MVESVEVGSLHIPVMRDRVVELLSPALQLPGSVYLDCTLGLGGHTEAVLRACPAAKVVAIDRDPQAIELARARLAPFGERVEIHHAVYHQLDEVLPAAGLRGVDAILADLGLSSLQIDRAERGFAYATDAPLDMRMDQSVEGNAADLLHTAEPAELVRILRRFGDERFAERIVNAIVAARVDQPIATTGRLVEIIASAIPVAARHSGGHPAKRTFQALRIAVNDELTSLADFLPRAMAALRPGGRMAVLAYHSGEDRLVKRAFAQASSDNVPHGLPQVPLAHRARFALLTRGAERPDGQESQNNPRAASARLRAIVAQKEIR